MNWDQIMKMRWYTSPYPEGNASIFAGPQELISDIPIPMAEHMVQLHNDSLKEPK